MTTKHTCSIMSSGRSACECQIKSIFTHCQAVRVICRCVHSFFFGFVSYNYWVAYTFPAKNPCGKKNAFAKSKSAAYHYVLLLLSNENSISSHVCRVYGSSIFMNKIFFWFFSPFCRR